MIEEHEGIIEKVISKDFIMSDFETFRNDIKELFNICKQNTSGNNADYIPELANANPDNWGVSITTIDGQQLNIGDTEELFSIQSTSKPISYAIALGTLG